MSPLVKDQIRRLCDHFHGEVHVLQDNGDTAIVLIDPSNRGLYVGKGDPSDAWMRVSEPCLMLIDPSRPDYPRVLN